MHCSRRHRLALLCALSLFSTAPAMAANSLLLIDAPPAQSTVSIGATARGWPAAPGASQNDHALLPAFDFAAPNGFFASTDDSIGWNLAPLLMSEENVKTWQWGARLWPQWGRPRRLAPPGSDSTGTRVLGEAFANMQALPYLLLQSGLSWGSGRRHNGGQLELGATSGIPIDDDLIGVTLAVSAANAAQMRTAFGVNPMHANSGNLPAWRPSAGLQDGSIAFSWEHKFSPDWSVSGQWLGARLLGDAARSPLTQSRFQPSFTFSLWRRL